MAQNSPATLTVPEAAALLGISRNAAYEAARKGELAGIPVIRVGSRRLVVPRAPLEALLGLSPAPVATGTDRLLRPDQSDLPEHDISIPVS